jgi:hypothetical protein
MSTIPEQQTQVVNPEEVRSAMSAAFADFLADESTNAMTLLIDHEQNVDSTILTTESTDNGNDLSGNNRPPTPYAVSTPTNSGMIFYFLLDIQLIN